ncbi:MAG: histidine phosphatase family protein [Acidimicrobiia bacterium]
MAKTVTLIRHAETTANQVHRWQGSLNSPLSSRGQQQAARLGTRLAPKPPDILVASDLDRTLSTASFLGDPEPDSAWREFGIGNWEGLTADEIRDRFPGEMERLFAGDDIAPGGGEQMSGFRARIAGAFDRLVDSMAEDGDAVVVTHGGVVWALIGEILGSGSQANRTGPPSNTGITQIRVTEDGRRQVSVLNDSTHLNGIHSEFGPDGSEVTIIRHGQTEGNVAGRWQGTADSRLTALGRRQAASTASVAPDVQTMYSSPLGRAVETAHIIGTPSGLAPEPHDGLIEMAFGRWEDMTVEQAKESDPELFKQIYHEGVDEPRGRSGESFTQAGERMAETIRAIAANANQDPVAVVSHGAAIRAYFTRALGLGFAERNRLPIPRNSSMSRVMYFDDDPVIMSYNVAPHLD